MKYMILLASLLFVGCTTAQGNGCVEATQNGILYQCCAKASLPVATPAGTPVVVP